MRPSPKVLHQEVSGESVLLDLATEKYFGLNTVGTQVWKGLESGHDLEQIASSLEAQFEVTRERARADVEALVAELLDAGLLLRD